jgi:aryl-alcohol dehydrogenase-like predicted oxidoreductase
LTSLKLTQNIIQRFARWKLFLNFTDTYRSFAPLKTDRIDLLWVHAWDGTVRPQELMRALDDLVRSGKVLHVGMSNAPAWVIAQCSTLADWRGWSNFVALPIEYNLVERTAERELLPLARNLKFGVLAWSPLASGVLTGKYSRTDNAGSRRLDQSEIRTLDDRSAAIAQAVVEVAENLSRKPAHVALAWLAARGIIPVLGATSLDQLKDNLGYRDLLLGTDENAILDKASAIELGYPHDLLARVGPGMRAALQG